MRVLIAIPVYNEAPTVSRVLEAVLERAGNVLVVDDGSTDETPRILSDYPVDVLRHCVNRGYGKSIRDSFRWAASDGYDWVITMDCDEQHEPAEIPSFIDAAESSGLDVISGSRYLRAMEGQSAPPTDRLAINQLMTGEINQRLGLNLTDSFCGFKAFRVEALRRLRLTNPGYAFPMQFWVQAVAAGLRIGELPVRLIYKDYTRTFGGTLDDPRTRLAHYRTVLHKEIVRRRCRLPSAAMEGLEAPALAWRARSCCG